MGRPATKMAVSIPDDLYRALERARRRHGKSRSAVVQAALKQWLRRETELGLVREYEEGYRRQPETATEVYVAEATAARLFGDEDW